MSPEAEGDDEATSGWAGDPGSVVARALLARPDLWWTGLVALKRLAPPRWWRRGSHLPLPHRAWWQFRMVTAYGRADAHPRAGDVIAYLEWCRSTGRRGGSSRYREGTPDTERLHERRSG
jgi:hypothetical protein